MLLYKSEIMTFLIFQCMEMCIHRASCDGFVDLDAIMMKFKLCSVFQYGFEPKFQATK
jgi:hypothetical protein